MGYFLVSGIVLILIGIGLGCFLNRVLASAQIKKSKETAEKILKDANKEAENIKKDEIIKTKDSILQLRAEFEKEVKERRLELQNYERRLHQKEEHYDRKFDVLEKRESELSRRERAIVQLEKVISLQEKKYQTVLEEVKTELEKIAAMTAEEAKKKLMENIENEARHDAAKLLKQIEDDTREIADRKAKEIISLAIQRYAGEYVVENTVSVVNLPNEEMKGRIIGREGRNIRAIEAATGVDLIVDDTPEAVIISGFDPIRREIAKISLERLIVDGRIHPARIEEIVKKVEQEIETSIREAGEQATFDVGVHGIHPELVKLLGKLKYRTSYSQNVYQHSIEVSFLCGIMAAELGLNVKQAKRAGLLHDIGKAIDHEVEGAHAMISADLAKKYGESNYIVHAIAAHNEDIKAESVLAILVQAADALSAARPGARRQTLESYIKRLQDLERIAKSFEGIEKSYAIQAGREIRIIVENQSISDEEAVLLAKNIARKIEKELTYPGQIKVNVIRETRAVEYAK